MKSLDAERQLETTVAAPDEQATLDVRGLREFFRDSVHDALIRQQVGVDTHTEHYVVNLLTMFSRSEALFEQTPEGVRLRPLAVMLAEAAATTSAERRSRALQRLGDVSLFVAGFFAQSFARKLVDIDYHIAMGGRAYGNTGRQLRARSPRARARCRVRRARRKVPAAGRCVERSQRDVAPSQRSRRPAAVRDLAQDGQSARPRDSCCGSA
jgi:hypothetical protein